MNVEERSAQFEHQKDAAIVQKEGSLVGYQMSQKERDRNLVNEVRGSEK